MAVVALVSALGGGAVAGVAVTALNKKERKQARKISKKVAKKQARKLDKRIELLPGPKGAPGPQGPRGLAGKDAASVFAAINTGAQGDAIDVAFGSGAVGVSKQGVGDYSVDFDRDLSRCAAMVTTGAGFPRGNVLFLNTGYARARIEPGNTDTVQVVIRKADGSTDFGAPVDASFFVAALC